MAHLPTGDGKPFGIAPKRPSDWVVEQRNAIKKALSNWLGYRFVRHG
jgi:hypothetical protein